MGACIHKYYNILHSFSYMVLTYNILFLIFVRYDFFVKSWTACKLSPFFLKIVYHTAEMYCNFNLGST